MTLQFRTVRLGTPREESEGLRLGTVRYLPRGVPKLKYRSDNYFDVWLPNLAPSRELLRELKDGLATNVFFRRYQREMRETEPRQLIQVLAALAKTTPISVGCYCDDESVCHRSVLGELIRAAAETA